MIVTIPSPDVPSPPGFSLGAFESLKPLETSATQKFNLMNLQANEKLKENYKKSTLSRMILQQHNLCKMKKLWNC